MSADREMHLQQEIIEKITWLGRYGGDPAGGVTRCLYTDVWKDAQEALKQLFQDEGLRVYYDEVGNLFGRLEGTGCSDETILTGSHVDTVRNGGLFDGQLGIIAGFLAIQHLKNKYGQPLRNLEVVSMAEEEGSRFPYSFWGSKNIVGQAVPDEMRSLRDFEGVSFESAMTGAGFHYKQENVARTDLKAFIELHIEQGGILEAEKIPLGIVQHIAGQRRFTLEVRGVANHAGTTPMGYRRDAMNAAARMIHRINDLALSYGDPLVATVGRVRLEPNTVNVVPGKVQFTLDVRHTQKTDLARFTDDVMQHITAIAQQLDVQVDMQMWMDEDPVPMDPNLVQVIRAQCDQLGMNYKLMHSGAGHDSQIMAPFMPTAMIFVPSRYGISHSPNEYTDPQDLVAGVKALTGTLYHLGYTREVSLQR